MDEAMLAGIQSEDSAVRIRAIEQLSATPSTTAVQAVIAALDDEDPQVRIACIAALAPVKSLESIPGLVKQLAAAEPNVRQSAANAFWVFGSQNPPANVLAALQVAVDGLIHLLSDLDPAVRLAASGALACVRSRKSLPALRQAAHDTDDEVRRNSVWAVGRIPDAESLPLLVEVLLSDKVPIIRRNAAVAISDIAAEGLVDSRLAAQHASSALLLALKDDHEKVRQNAAHALAALPSQRAVEQIVAVFDDPSPDVRQYAAWAVGEMNPTDQITGKKIDFAEAFRGLCRLLSDSVDRVRQYAVWAISQVAKKDRGRLTAAYLELAVPTLAGLLKDSNARVRHNAAYALAYTSSEVVIPSLVESLSDADPEVRGCAAFALGNIGSHYAVPALIESLSDEEESVRYRTTETLKYLASLADTKPLAFDIALKLAVPEIVNALDDSSALVRKEAVNILSELDYRRTIPDLIDALKDTSEEVRAKAAWALGEMEAKDAVAALVVALRDPAPIVRRAAVLSLGSIGQIECLPAIRALLTDDDPDVQHDAKLAILRLPLPSDRQPVLMLGTDAGGKLTTNQSKVTIVGTPQEFDWEHRPETYWDGKGCALGDRFHMRNLPLTMIGFTGEHLPKLREGEVEIALVKLRTITGDVLSFRACRGEQIAYRVVDEYSMDLPLVPRQSTLPLSFRELTDILITAAIQGSEPLLIGHWRQGGKDFVSIDSDFYPQLGEWCTHSAARWSE